MSANPPFDEVDAACLLCATVYIRAWGHQLGMVTLLELVDWTIFFFFFFACCNEIHLCISAIRDQVAFSILRCQGKFKFAIVCR